MSEGKVQVPEGMLDAALQPVDRSGHWSCEDEVEARIEAALQWLVANPQVPTDEQMTLIWNELDQRLHPVINARFACEQFQRRFLFAPAEPEDPLKDLQWERGEARSRPLADAHHNAQIAEAYRRGQQSMITKEKQP